MTGKECPPIVFHPEMAETGQTFTSPAALLLQESVLTNYAKVWFACCTAAEKQDLHRVVKTALQLDYATRLRKQADRICTDHSGPGHSLLNCCHQEGFRAIKTGKTNSATVFMVSIMLSFTASPVTLPVTVTVHLHNLKILLFLFCFVFLLYIIFIIFQ